MMQTSPGPSSIGGRTYRCLLTSWGLILLIFAVSSTNAFGYFSQASKAAFNHHNGLVIRAGILKAQDSANTNDDPYSKSEWLVAMGFSEADILRMQRKFPNEQVEANLWKTARVLRDEVGLSEKDTNRALLRMVPSLDLSATADLRPKIAFWKQERGVPNEHLHRMVRAFPQMLVCRLEENVRPSVRFLQRELILSEQETNKVLVRMPQLLDFNSTTNLKPKLDFWREERGLSAEEVGRMVRKFPPLLALSVDTNIKPTLEWYEGTMGVPRHVMNEKLAASPKYLSSSLSKRLIPRGERLVSILGQLGHPADKQISSLRSLAFQLGPLTDVRFEALLLRLAGGDYQFRNSRQYGRRERA
uniref:Uncharacterized protein n=1 Tax=Heterosigma akashiwo TaxID=2829 RepID=A0A6V1SPS3_HETAK